MSIVTVNNTTRTVAVSSAGTQGPAGVKWRGAWAAGSEYAPREGVLHRGSSYRCIEVHTSDAGSEPGLAADWQTYWMLLAEKGAQGDRGPRGEQGRQGEQGLKGDKGDTGDAYESYGVSVYKADGIAAGGYYADRRASAASTQAKLYAEVIDGDPGSEVDLIVQVGGAVAHGPFTVSQGAPVSLSGLAIAVAEDDKVGFILTSVTGGIVREMFIKSYGAIS